MGSKLTDQLLKEILSWSLLVSDELFADSGAVSPFKKPTYPAADILTVCKRWKRVATPALYQTVVIRSTAQAEALAFALERNPGFGRYIKRLRVEGAFGPHLGKIAPFSRYITDFCFSLAIYSDARVKGLLQLLAGINPERVILTTPPAQVLINSHHTEVLRALCAQISAWTKLRVFNYSRSFCVGRGGHRIIECDAYPEIAAALAKSPSLRTVQLWQGAALGPGPSAAFNELATSPTITAFLLQTPRPFGDLELQRCIPASMRARLRIAVDQPPRACLLPEPVAPIPFYTPLSGATPATRSALWSRIISFAVLRSAFEPSSYDYITTWFDPDQFTLSTAKSLLLTSRSFFNLTAPILLEHIAIGGSVAQLSALRHYLEEFHVAPSTVHIIPWPKFPADAETLVFKLTSLQSATLSASTPILAALGRASGLALSHLTIESRHGVKLDVAAISQFRQLATLCFTDRLRLCGIEMDCAGSLPADALSSLRALAVSNGRQFLQKVTVCTMPMLEELRVHPTVHEINILPAGFLERHGQKLRRISVGSVSRDLIDACTRLLSLELLEEVGAPSPDPWEAGHATIAEIKLHWKPRLSRTGLPDVAAWRVFFATFTRALYPSLREIRLMNSASEIWPTTEREIKKSHWPAFAAILAAHGISLLDHSGRAWRPRNSRFTHP